MKINCYIIEEVNGEYIKYVEDTIEFHDFARGCRYIREYNRNSSELNTPDFIRIAWEDLDALLM